MKKAIFLLVMSVCAALSAETVQNVLQDKNIQIVINEIVNNTDNDIRIIKAGTNQVIMNIPAGKTVDPNYTVEINDPVMGLPLDSHMSSDEFLVKGWDSLGENVEVKFRVSARAEDGKIQRVGVSLVGDSVQDPMIDLQQTSVLHGSDYKMYMLSIKFENEFNDSEILLEGIKFKKSGFKGAR